MCQFFSGVVTKTGIVYDLDNDSHEFLLEKAGLRDDTHFPNFVRVELLPKDGDVFNHDLNNWALRVDQDYLPDWFDREAAEEEMKKLIQTSWQERFIINNQSWQKRHGQRIFVKNAKVNIINGRVEAWDKSSVVAGGNSSVVARGNSFVEAWDNSFVEARGNSSVMARGNSSVEARDNSSVVAWGNSSVEAWDNSSVEAWDNSLVVIPSSKNIKVKGVYYNATIKDLSGSKPKLIVSNDFTIEHFKGDN